MNSKYDFKLKSERIRFYKQSAWKGINGVRNKVVERDKECVWCRDKGLVTVTNLEVDHIKPVEECTYAEALDIENLRTLCRSCHNDRHDRFNGTNNFKRNRFAEDEKW